MSNILLFYLNSPVFTPSNLFHFQVTIDSEIGSVVGQVRVVKIQNLLVSTTVF